MKLEDQVCKLELATELKNLGLKQEGTFYWLQDYDDGQKYTLQSEFWWVCADCDVEYGSCNCSLRKIAETKDEEDLCFFAPTVAELGELLPTLVITWCKSNDGNGTDFWWGKTHYPSLEKQIEVNDTNEANARAKMLIKSIKAKIAVLP